MTPVAPTPAETEAAPVVAEPEPVATVEPAPVQDEPAVSQPEVVETQPLVAEPVTPTAVTAGRLVATSPVTKAEAPAWVAEPVKQSDWVRPVYHFTGKGAAGGHAARHHATADVTKAS